MSDLIWVADSDVRLEDLSVSAMGESYPATDVMRLLPYRDGRTLVYSAWAPNILHVSGADFGSVTLTGDPVSPASRYRLSLSALEQRVGTSRMLEAWRLTLQRSIGSPPGASCGPYSLRLSPSTLYFHDMVELYLLVVDLLLSGDHHALSGHSLVVLPTMVPPEAGSLDFLRTIDWYCHDFEVPLFICTLNPGWYSRLTTAVTLPLSEHDMHHRRVADSSVPASPARFPYFAAWDPRWPPDIKGMPLVCELFRSHGMSGLLHIKIPDGYPDGSPESHRFFQIAAQYRDTINLVTMAPGRPAFLRALQHDADTFVYACAFDVGPRVVMECASLNKKILFHDGNDCDLVSHGLFNDIEGFELFNADTFQTKVATLRAATARTVNFLASHNWLRTRDFLRQAVGDPELAGFVLEEYPQLATEAPA